MSAASVKGREEIVARAGTGALSLLAVPFNAAVVRALAGGARPLVELRREAGSPPQTTMRGYLRSLARAGVVEKHREKAFAGTVSYELTESGRALLIVADHLSTWLEHAPGHSIALGSVEAKRAVKALVEGWSTSIVRALASRPLSLTQLDKVITWLNYPSLERRVSAMRLLGMVEPIPDEGKSTPYVVTDWLRRAIAPLAAAAHWEQLHRPAEAPPITNRDVEAAFLLVLPLLRLPVGVSGSCRLAVETRNGKRHGLAGVLVETHGGMVVSGDTDLTGHPEAWVLGPAPAWFSAVAKRNPRELQLGGKKRLAASLVDGLREALSST